MAKIELGREERDDAVRRLRGYFERERDEELGDLAVGLFFDFITEEIGPYFYNKGLSDAQSYVARFTDSLDADLEAGKRFPPRAPGRSPAAPDE
jgi:uncharacterized protein (DUF2164 family)